MKNENMFLYESVCRQEILRAELSAAVRGATRFFKMQKTFPADTRRTSQTKTAEKFPYKIFDEK